MNYLQWISDLFGLIENYSAVRAQGATSQQANLGVLAAGLAIVQHLTSHPAVSGATAPATPLPFPATVTPLPVQVVAPSAPFPGTPITPG